MVICFLIKVIFNHVHDTDLSSANNFKIAPSLIKMMMNKLMTTCFNLYNFLIQILSVIKK